MKRFNQPAPADIMRKGHPHISERLLAQEFDQETELDLADYEDHRAGLCDSDVCEYCLRGD